VSLGFGDEHREAQAKTSDRARKRYQNVDIPVDSHRNQSFFIKLQDSALMS
jgi:hypothetical protein